MVTSDPVMPSGAGLSVFGDIDSTNALALRAAQKGQGGPHWFMARSQSAGRGRQGREWHSDAGNLFASLLITVSCKPEDIPQLSFVSALGVHDALIAMMEEGPAPVIPGADDGKGRKYTGGVKRLSLKWPNDVLLDGAKLAGILLETSSAGADAARRQAVIGIGINLAHCPEIRGKPTICLADCNIDITPQKALSHLAASFDKRLRDWGQGRNFAKMRRDWLERAEGIGKAYSATVQNKNLSGVFENIDKDGALVLRLASGERQRITSGEVHPAEGINS